MTTPDDTQPEALLKAAPALQRTGKGPEDLLRTTEQEKAQRVADYAPKN